MVRGAGPEADTVSRGKLEPLTEYRQSHLRALEMCPRRLLGALKVGDLATGWSESSADLGTVVHAVLAEIMATLRRVGAIQMPTEEAMVVAREVYAASPIVLPSEEHDDMLWMVRSFCAFRWQPQRIMAVEEPLRQEIVCEDGVARVLKGQPDLILADPPRGIVILDWKSGRSKPRGPQQPLEDGATVEGIRYLSNDGKFQRQVYGLLGLLSTPAAEYATLRELPLRFPGEGPREARLHRAELEHVQPRVAALMQKLARGIEEGEESDVWRPKPGRQCAKCEVGRSCPVPPEQRGDGALSPGPDADAAAAEWALIAAKDDQLRVQLRTLHEETGYAPKVNEREEARWDPPRAVRGEKRKFGLHPRLDVAVAAETRGST